jgi:putative peptidoglycan lipid II flippase
MPQPPASAFGSAIVLFFFRAINAVLALAVGVLSASLFGTSIEKDCYLVAQTIPMILGTVLVGGLYPTLVVSLTQLRRTEGVAAESAFLRLTLRNLTLLGSVLLLCAMVFPREMIHLIAPGFDASRVELSAGLFRVSAVGALVWIYFGTLRAPLESRGRFAPSGLCHLVIGCTSLLTLWTLTDRFGIFALAFGPVAGNILGAVALGWTIVVVTRLPASTPGAPINRPLLAQQQRRLWLSFIPMSVADSVTLVNIMVDNAFGSYLPAGNIAMLGFAFVIVSNIYLIVTVSLADVALPRMAAAALEGREALRGILRSGLRHIVLITLPAAFGIVVFGEPISRLLFERGAFQAESTRGVAHILLCFSPAVVLVGILALLLRSLFAIRRYGLVGLTSIAAMAANAGLDWVLVGPLGINGIALGTTITIVLHVGLLLPFVRREVGRITVRDDAVFLVKVVTSGAVMAGGVLLVTRQFEAAFDTSREAVRLMEVLGVCALGAGLYAAGLLWMRVDEARALLERSLGFLRRKSGRVPA